jgi:DNA polymerase I-like protein with 3'-5' exonuclease and polymerase domains
MDPWLGKLGVITGDRHGDDFVVHFSAVCSFVVRGVDLDPAATAIYTEGDMAIRQSIWDPDYTKYAVIDCETTVKAGEPWKFKGTPAHRGNLAVAWGIKRAADSDVQLSHLLIPHAGPLQINKNDIIVGHNVKFDLQYLMKQRSWHPDLVWDTGVAHYMMLGQKPKMPSLNEVAEFYGLGQKEEGIKELWDMGVQTEDIDPTKLLDYLKQDVLLTEAIYKAQLERLKDLPKLRDHILRVSTASQYLAICEYHGLPTREHKLSTQALTTHLDVDLAKSQLYQYAEDRYNIPPLSRDLWDPTTPSNVGKLLFDLPIEIEDWEPAGRVLKSGKISKRRNRISVVYQAPEDKHHTDIGLLPIPKTQSGAIQTSDDLLDLLAKHVPGVVEPVKAYRAASKLASTYLDPSLEFGRKAGVSTLHPSFHLTTTNTGRSSSSGPNAQQFPPELEKCIVAQHGHWLVKADFKQLQICGVAMLSGDPQLLDDMKNDRDIHYETGKTVFGWKDPSEMNKADRRTVKNTNFGLLFGGKAGGISKQTGVSKALTQKCIDAFFLRYPQVQVWINKNIDLVEQIAIPAEGEFIDGNQVREAFLQTPAGRVLRFVERVVPDWVRAKTGRAIGFSPNEIANYPVQAYTDGDLALTYLAILGVLEDRKFTACNFVHDAVWVLTSDVAGTKLQLQEALDELNTKMGLSVPLNLDFTVEDSNGDIVV